MTSGVMRSRVTKKAQVILPAELRKQLHIEPGKPARFGRSERGIVMEPIQDIVDSAGELSKFASSSDVMNDLLEVEEEGLPVKRVQFSSCLGGI